MLKISDTNAIPQVVHQVCTALTRLQEAGKSRTLDLKFTSLASAYNFRDSMYATRTFLRSLYKDNTNEYSAYTAMHRLLEQTTISRITREVFDRQMAILGHLPVKVTSIDDRQADTLQQLDAILSTITMPQTSPLAELDTTTEDIFDLPEFGIHILADMVISHQAIDHLHWLTTNGSSALASSDALQKARLNSRIKALRDNSAWFLIDPFSFYEENNSETE